MARPHSSTPTLRVYSVNVEPFPAGQGHVSIGSCLPGLCDALGFIPRTTQS